MLAAQQLKTDNKVGSRIWFDHTHLRRQGIEDRFQTFFVPHLSFFSYLGRAVLRDCGISWASSHIYIVVVTKLSLYDHAGHLGDRNLTIL